MNVLKPLKKKKQKFLFPQIYHFYNPSTLLLYHLVNRILVCVNHWKFADY